MARQFYSRRHYERISNGEKDTQSQIDERELHRELVERITREISHRWPAPWSTKDVEEVFEWQRKRIVELTNA